MSIETLDVFGVSLGRLENFRISVFGTQRTSYFLKTSQLTKYV